MLRKVESHVRTTILVLIFLIVLGTVVYRYLEGWNWIQSFYFSITTVTTVGYGDLMPSSDVSRLFTAFYILAGVTTAFTSIGFIGSEYIVAKERKIVRATKKLIEEKEEKE